MQQPTHIFPRTIGMDLGRFKSNFCVFTSERVRGEEGAIRSTREEIRAFFKAQPKSRIVMEACGPCRWIAEEATRSGHEVIVANPREFRVILSSHKKSDRNDARVLGEFGQLKPSVLHPVKLRGTRCQSARSLLQARAHLVGMRTKLINLIGATIRDMGVDLGPSGASATFYKRVESRVPVELKDAIEPTLAVLKEIGESINAMDRSIERVSREDLPETAVLRQVNGVGPIVALTVVATIEDPGRFACSRDVGAYAGLTPRSRASCESQPELSISKRGDAVLRKALVNAATYILGPRGQDCDLKRWGLGIQGRGGQAARGKARIAVARKLAALLHHLMATQQVYEPNRLSPAGAA